MDPFCDNFISYENQSSPNFENLLESGFSLTSPFTESVDSFSHFPDFFPKTIQNFLDPNILEHKDSSDFSSLLSVPKSKPFQIIKSKKTDSSVPSERLDCIDQLASVSPLDLDTESENKINNRSKRIAKVAKAKGRVQMKQDVDDFIDSVDVHLVPEGLDDPTLDKKTQKKMVKMLKNRVSAQNSRDRKKMYAQQLEEMNAAYAEENTFLKQDRNILLEKIEKLEADYAQLCKENEAMRNNAINMCYKCGSSGECETATPTEQSDNPASPLSQTISSNNGNSGFSIFSVALTALLCFLFVITGGQLGQFPLINNIKTPTIIRLSKSLISEFTTSSLKRIEDWPISVEDLEASLKDLNFGDLPVFNKIKPLMEQFEKFHQSVTQYSDDNSNAINEIFGAESKFSTLFVPASFELSKNIPQMEVEGETAGNFQFVTGLKETQHLALEKADYLQLLVPRSTIGRLNVAEDSNEIKSVKDQCNGYEGDNTMIEVWCKVLARRESVISPV